ncbi:hypothetical protein B0H13DRAFT_1926217 [Mycena leptocephala]|nr:hypothetical protein B0H13DRAFT_1926217 [Mycena leptocephala]
MGTLSDHEINAILSISLFLFSRVAILANFKETALDLADLKSLQVTSLGEVESGQISNQVDLASCDSTFRVVATLPWTPGHKIVGLLNITSTDEGILSCKINWDHLVQQLLGPGAVFGPNHELFSPDQLKAKFPVEDPNESESTQRAYLKKKSVGPCVAGALTPPGWITDLHVGFAGYAQAVVHCAGEKVWLVWPPTETNLKWWAIIIHTQPPVILRGCSEQ